MASVGRGVYELRIRTEVEHRVFYVAKFEAGVYVLHAFLKDAENSPARYRGRTGALPRCLNGAPGS